MFKVLQGPKLNLGHLASLGAMTAVIPGLTTAGLAGWNLNRKTQTFNQSYTGEPDFRAQTVHQAGYIQGNSVLFLILDWLG